MGGTFDPIHLGHLRAAESAREELSLDVVLFVPAGDPPHREPPVATSLDRFSMVALATAGHPGFLASDIEIRRSGPSYTIDTLTCLTSVYPGSELVLIVGADTYPEMAGWREHKRLLSLCVIAMIDRPGVPTPVVPNDGVLRVTGTGLAISATAIRQKVAAGQSVRYLVPTDVADYITKRGLYR